MYHSVDYAQTDRARANTVSPEAFERQMAFLKRGGYQVLSVETYVQIIREKKKFAPKSVVITFDDGLLNNYTNAYPILMKYGIPAVMFIPSSYVGRLDAGVGPPKMNADQLREISAHGVTIGSHVATEAYLPSLGQEAAQKEIVDSKAVLEELVGRRVEYLAYPSGGFSEEIKAMVRDAGYQAAFTTNRGFDRGNRDLYELKRIRPKDSDGRIELWMKCSGYYNLLRKSKKPF